MFMRLSFRFLFPAAFLLAQSPCFAAEECPAVTMEVDQAAPSVAGQVQNQAQDPLADVLDGLEGFASNNPVDQQRALRDLIQQMQQVQMQALMEARKRRLQELTPQQQASFARVEELYAQLDAKLRLPATLLELIAQINPIPEKHALVAALASFKAAIEDGSYRRLFFGDVRHEQSPSVPGMYDLKELLELVSVLKDEQGEAAQKLLDIVKSLVKADYQAVSTSCYQLQEEAIEALKKSLAEESKRFMAWAAQKHPTRAQEEAVTYYAKLVSQYLHSVVSVQKIASKASGAGWAWLVQTFAQIYDIMQPYFITEGHFSLTGVVNVGINGQNPHIVQQFFSKAMYLDVACRTSVALVAMMQSGHVAAGRDLSQVIIGDAPLARFIDPSNEGTHEIALFALVQKLGAYRTHLAAAGNAFQNPAQYALQMGAISKFMVRLACAIAWQNATALWQGTHTVDQLLHENIARKTKLYKAVMRLGIFTLQGYVTGTVQKFVYEHVGPDTMYAIEDLSLGIVSPALMFEFLDICVNAFLQNRPQWVTDHVVDFNQVDVHGYTDYWYLKRMVEAYLKTPGAGRVPFYGSQNGFMEHNKWKFVEYRLLYYVFGAMGRHFGRKFAEKYNEHISYLVGEAGGRVLDVCEWAASKGVREEDYQKGGEKEGVGLVVGVGNLALRHPTEALTFLLSGIAMEIMHGQGSLMRNQAISFLRQINVLRPEIQDEQMINDALAGYFIQALFMYGIFDYKQAVECHQQYVTYRHNVPALVPYLVDKIRTGIITSLGGFAGRHLGYKVAECFFTDPTLPAPAVP